MQPKWNSCAQTRADLTQKFLEQVKGAVHGDLCVQGEYLGDFDCKKLETSGSSQLSRKLTQKDSETPGPWWEDKQVELRLLLSASPIGLQELHLTSPGNSAHDPSTGYHGPLQGLYDGWHDHGAAQKRLGQHNGPL